VGGKEFPVFQAGFFTLSLMLAGEGRGEPRGGVLVDWGGRCILLP
jgi:hypothetical protein